MAAFKAVDATLTASTVSTLTITAESGQSFSQVTVKTTGEAIVYYTLDGSTPTVGGDNCAMMQATEKDEHHYGSSWTSVTLKAISSGTPTVSLEGR